MNYPRKTFRGFTLVEIMVAVGIMVLLATVVIILVGGMDAKAKKAKTQAQMKMLGEAVTAFRSATGYFPLAVPEESYAMGWSILVDNNYGVNWNGQNPGRPNWRNYFRPNNGNLNARPVFSWENNSDPNRDPRPTNIHMLAFQLEQVPEANKIFAQIKQNNAVAIQKKFTLDTNGLETWSNASDTCQLGHPLDPAGNRQVYQVQDAWGTPLRFWTSDTLTWAKRNFNFKAPWSTSIQTLLSSKLQQANWGFFIESAGKDGKFGWYGRCGSNTPVNSKQAEDNIYSVGE